MNENLKRHRPDIKVLGEGKATAFMPEDPMGVWVHIQEVRDLLDVKDKVIADLEKSHKKEVGQLLMEIAGLQREDGIPHGSACEGRKQSEAGIQLRTGNPERRMGIMKCDELKPIRQGSVELGEYWVYDAEEVDAAIAELKAALKESEDARYEAGADAADYYQENRKLKRALYKACANWADLEVFDRTVGIDDPNVEANRWALMRNRCLKKAEEYK